MPAGAATFDEQWLSEAANDLVAKPGASLVLAGRNQPVVVQLLVYAINAALKNLGQTLVVRAGSAQSANDRVFCNWRRT